MKDLGQFIYFIRGEKVMLDSDLAMLYGIETKNLNKAVSRNKNRFPEDFMFKLSKDEWKSLKFQIGTSKKKHDGKGGKRYLPHAFTEQGVAMLSSVLRSPQAVAVNIQIIRTFILMRHALSAHKELEKELKEIKSFLLKNSQGTSKEFKRVWQAIESLAEKPEVSERRIGFKLE